MADIGPILISMFVAIILGGIIGLERSYHGHPAGFRRDFLFRLRLPVDILDGKRTLIDSTLWQEILS